MDPASFSFAVIAMFLTCCRGYSIFSDAYNAPSDAQDAARKVRIEGAHLANWGDHFEIRPNLQEEQSSGKLNVYLMRAPVRGGVFDVLCAISESFTDIKKLDRKYGIVFGYHQKGNRSPRIPRDVQDLLHGQDPSRSPAPKEIEDEDERMKRELRHFKVRMSLLEKCRWSLRGKERIEGLIQNLRRYNEDLFRLCSWEDQSQLNRGLPTFVVPLGRNFMDLHLVANIAEEAAQDKTSPLAEGRHQTAIMARFKARVMTPVNVSTRYQPRWRLLDQKDYLVLSSSSAYSLSTSLRNQDSVFVQWRSFKGKDNRPNRLAEEQIHELGDFLTVPHRPPEFRALECVGLFKDKANTRYGLVYELPEYLRGLRTENRSVFNPSTLTKLMRDVHGSIDLGIRFDLAKKLIYSVVVLHTCGWLHKNLCSDNIVFFPARPSTGEKVKSYRKDVGRPIIVGYGLSRPDDVPAEEKDLPGGRANELYNGYSAAQHYDSHNDENKQPKINIYQHPDKAANPDRRFRHSYDIYSLGLVLLEIGLWQSLQNFDSGQWKDAYDFRNFVLDRLVPDLWGQCGSIYGRVVRECLTLDSRDLAVAEEGQRRLAWNFAEWLERCVA